MLRRVARLIHGGNVMKLFTPILVSSTLAVSAIAGIAYAGENKSKDDDYTIEKIGEAETCISRSRIRSTDVIDDQTIDFKMVNGDIYRNTLPNKCGNLGFEESFSYSTSTDRLCNVDIIRVLNNIGGTVQPGTACGLGKFQQIEKTKIEKPDS